MSHHKPGCKATVHEQNPAGMCLGCGGRMFPEPEPALDKEEAFALHRMTGGERVKVAQRPVSKEERPFAGLEGRFLRHTKPHGFAVIAVKEADAKDVLDLLAQKPANGEVILTLHTESLRRVTA